MLPGFRFLCAAIMLTISLVVFGLGAAALLRSAHEEFATIPTRRAPSQPVFAQQTETPPTLAMLRLEPRTAQTELSAPVTTVLPAEPAELPATPAAPDKQNQNDTVAALSLPAQVALEKVASEKAASPEPSSPETAKIEAPMPEPVVTVAVASPTTVELQPAAVPKINVVEPAPDTDAPQQAATLTDDDARLSSTKIAVLGGPPVDTEPVPLPMAKPILVPAKKVERQRRVIKRKRVAARPATQAAAQPTAAADPFGLPVPR